MVLFTLTSLLPLLCAGHSWVEELSLIRDGIAIDASGFARQNVARDGDLDVDAFMTYTLLSRPGVTIKPADRICSPRQVLPDLNTALRAQAGDTIVLQHQENGHVTLQDQDREALGKLGPGEVFVYATTNSRPEDALTSIHRVWKEDQSGGDRRGVLLGRSGFDDGRCYQVNSGALSLQRQAAFPHAAAPPQGADAWCTVNVTIPESIESGLLSLYWVWDWPAIQNEQYEEQFYTTCMDIIVM